MSENEVRVLGVRIDARGWDFVLECIQTWAAQRESRYICICNVHSVVTTFSDKKFRAVVDGSDLNTPDGSPLAWMLRKMGFPWQERINGPDLMWRYCKEAAVRKESIYLYGGAPHTLAVLQERLTLSFPGLKVAGAWSPPYRDLSELEDAEDIARINDSGAETVWVSLGCPKQEKWMAAHRGQVTAVMIGVGAAFDYHAGTIRRAPLWMQNHGLEWLFRLLSEPKRLWKRYLITNSIFVIGAAVQLLLSCAQIVRRK